MLKYCGTKLEVITTTNQIRETQHNKPMRTGLKHKKPWVAKSQLSLFFVNLIGLKTLAKLLWTNNITSFKKGALIFNSFFIHCNSVWWLSFISNLTFLCNISYSPFFFPFFLGGLPLNGAYDSFVDYSNNDVVYCHWIVINK